MRYIILLTLLFSSTTYTKEQCPPPTFPFQQFKNSHRVVSCMIKIQGKFLKEGLEVTYDANNYIVKQQFYHQGKLRTKIKRSGLQLIQFQDPTTKLHLSYPKNWKKYLVKNYDAPPLWYATKVKKNLATIFKHTIIYFQFSEITINNYKFFPTFFILPIPSTPLPSDKLCKKILTSIDLLFDINRLNIKQKVCKQQRKKHIATLRYSVNKQDIRQTSWIVTKKDVRYLLQFTDIPSAKQRFKAAQLVVDSITKQ